MSSIELLAFTFKFFKKFDFTIHKLRFHFAPLRKNNFLITPQKIENTQGFWKKHISSSDANNMAILWVFIFAHAKQMYEKKKKNSKILTRKKFLKVF